MADERRGGDRLGSGWRTSRRGRKWVDEMGFRRPSKIQAVTLPMILTSLYKNLVAQAHNGSGKTTCFVLGMLSRVDPSRRTPQAICICPTGELAQQVLIQADLFLNNLTSMCERSTEKGSMWVTMKRSSMKCQARLKKMASKGEPIEYWCLVCATDGKRNISTSGAPHPSLVHPQQQGAGPREQAALLVTWGQIE
ncbi:ATP-dependent RNA helicase FAL1 isoform X3 [Triticum aestivum]|uniref:ATP-dependent RNA helicase FAL1 isoform X3 n=3 Tax=Triticum TaxID=4564 RepID=UPI001D01A2CD|nr:ATP-dependent RNA helicase FAL1-like isoform X3 [Triticum aestivum]